jgi:hypothetical protein
MPGSTPGPYEELFAIVAVEGTHEGIVGEIVPGMGMAPFVTGSRRALSVYIPIARERAAIEGKRLRIVRFTRADEEPL